MATYTVNGKQYTIDQVNAAYQKATPDQRAALNRQTGLSYDVNTGTASIYSKQSTSPTQAQPAVKINTDVMKQYNPNYNPNVGSGVSGVVGTPTTTTPQKAQPVTTPQATKQTIPQPTPTPTPTPTQKSTSTPTPTPIASQPTQTHTVSNDPNAELRRNKASEYISGIVNFSKESGTPVNMDQNRFRSFTGYDYLSPEDKSTLDSYWNNFQGLVSSGQSAEQALNTLKSSPNTQQAQPTQVESTTPQPQVEKTTTTGPQGTTVVKKEVPGQATVDYNVGKGREQDILNNLNEGYKNDPIIQKALATGDYNTYKQAYGYDTADQTKKSLIDAYFQARQPKNSEAFFSILATGQKIENSKYRESPEARDAQHRYDVVSPYKMASTDTLYNAMVSGAIVPGSKAYTDLIMLNGGVETPDMVQAKAKYNNKKMVDNVNSSSEITGGKPYEEKPDYTQEISDKVVKNIGYDASQSFKEKISNNQEIKDAASDVMKTTARVKELERLKADSFSALKAQYPGLPMGALIVLASKQNEKIDRELNGLRDSLSISQSNLKYLTDLAEKEFSYEYEAYKDQREFSQQKELAQFQQDLGLRGDQAKFEQQMAQQAKIANDPVMATQQVIDTYAKMGILPERSTAEIVQSVKNDIAGGMTLAQSLTNLNKAFQSKPQYKAIVAQSVSGMTPYQQAQVDIERQKLSPVASGGVQRPDLLAIPDGAKVPTGRNQCGEYVNDVLGTPGLFKDSIQDKIKVTNSQDPSIGSAVVLESTGDYAKYGHVGIVIGMDENTITVKSSNRDGDGKITTDTFNRGYSRIKGYYDPTKSQVVNNPKATKELTGLRKEFNSLPQVKNYNEAKVNYQKILSSAKRDSAAGDISLIFSYMKTLDPTSTVREGEFATAQNSGGVADSVRNAYNKAINGERLTPNQRNDFVDTAKQLFGDYAKNYNIALEQYRSYITEGGDPNKIGEFDTVYGDGSTQITQPPTTTGITGSSSDEEIINYLKSK